MANIKSQKKRVLTNEKAHKRNVAVKSSLKTAVRATREAIAAGDKSAAEAAYKVAAQKLDKAAGAGVIHKNQAANRKSGIMRLANTVVTAEDIAAYEKPAPKPQKTLLTRDAQSSLQTALVMNHTSLKLQRNILMFSSAIQPVQELIQKAFLTITTHLLQFTKADTLQVLQQQMSLTL